MNVNDRVKTATVRYGYYGCESGCDGFDIKGFNESGKQVASDWSFEGWHGEAGWSDSKETKEQFATRLAREAFGEHVEVNMDLCEILEG